MPTDTEFTLSLFDNPALSSWTDQTTQAARTPSEIDQSDVDDAEEDNKMPQPAADLASRGSNFHLSGDRELARGWPARARDNIAAIRLSKALDESGRAPTADEQAQLLRFVGFGASELAQNCFRRPGEDAFRPDWQDIGTALEAAATPAEYAALQRSTQYAHYTPETIIRGLWRAAERLGFSGRRVLERAWAPACSSPCCPPRCARPAASPASNTTRSPPASRALFIRGRGCGARTTREAIWPAVSTW